MGQFSEEVRHRVYVNDDVTHQMHDYDLSHLRLDASKLINSAVRLSYLVDRTHVPLLP